MSLGNSAARTRSKLAIRVKKILTRIYLAFDESQRRRAAEVVHRYRHLIPDYDESSKKENKID